MKTRFIFLSLLCLFVSQVRGQDKECAAKASAVDSLIAVKEFDKAFETWKSAGKCISEPLYSSGEKLLVDKLEHPLSETERADYEAKLLHLYADYDRHFPGNSNANSVKKAMFLYRKDNNSPEVFDLLDKAFTKDRQNFTNAEGLYLYFDLYFKKSEQDQSVTDEMLIAKKDDITAHLGQLFAKTGSKEYHIASESMKNLASKTITCDKLEAHYGKQFDTKKSDVFWLQVVAENLFSSGCRKSEVFYKAAGEWHAKSQSPESAFYLGKAMLLRRNRPEAVKYLTQSAEGETDTVKKSKIYYEMAMLEVGNPSASIEMLRKAIKARPDFGDAYLMLAEMYASTDCGNTPLEKKARYLLAAQTALKAGEVQPLMKKTAEGQAEVYKKKAPSMAEIKDAKMKGKVIKYGCGINEMVTLPQ